MRSRRLPLALAALTGALAIHWPRPGHTVPPLPTAGAFNRRLPGADCPCAGTPDCLPLADLYRATGGPRWEFGEASATRANNNWCNGGSPCDETKPWLHLSCGDGTNEVTQIIFLDVMLSGSLPDSIGRMALQTLELYRTSLSGSLPHTIGGLTGLLYLRLDQTALSGTLPAAISSLTSVLTLNLQQTSLSGGLPDSIGGMIGLKQLFLSETFLSGSLPHTISGMARLQELELYKSRLRGTVVPSIGSLTQLSTAKLHTTFLSGELPSAVVQLSNLLELSLYRSSLSGTIPDGINRLVELKRLALFSTSLSGTLPSSLMQLEQVQLYQTSLSGTLPSSIAQSGGALKELYMYLTALSGTLPCSIGSLSTLQRLSLSSNLLSGTIPAAMGSMTGLQDLDLGGNRLQGSLPQHLGNLLQLRYLMLHTNQLRGSSSPSFANWSKLEYLTLSYNLGLDFDLGLLRNYTKLQTALLEGCNIRGTLPDLGGPGQLPSLRTLMLADNFLSGTVPSRFHSTPALETLALSNNKRLSGTLPASLRDLLVLKTLLANGLRLSGSIPNSWSDSSKQQGGATACVDLLDSNGLPWRDSQAPLEGAQIINEPNYEWKSNWLPVDADLCRGESGEWLGCGCGWYNRTADGLWYWAEPTAGSKILDKMPDRFTRCNASSLDKSAASLYWNPPYYNTASDHPHSGYTANVACCACGGGRTQVWRLETLSLARNYLRGPTDALVAANSLKTLLLSSNYLSGNVVALDEAHQLGEGRFNEPNTEAVVKLGDRMQTFVGLNPFKRFEEQTYSNIVLVFSGNSALTTSASGLPPSPAGNLLQRDWIQQGRHGLFSGDDQLKQLLWLVLPALLVVHLAAVLAAVWSGRCTCAFGADLLRYFAPCRNVGIEEPKRDLVLQHVLRHSIVASIILGLLGAGLVALNLATAGLFDNYGGSGDPLLRMTSTPIIPDTAYKWTWAVLSSLVLTAATALTSRLAAASQMTSATAFVECLTDFCNSHGSPIGLAVRTWRRRSMLERGIGLTRRLLFWLACLPVVLITSAPACAYVMANNISTADLSSAASLIVGLMGNALLITSLNLFLCSLVVPPATRWLARIRYGLKSTPGIHEPFVLDFLRTQVAIALLIEICSVVLAPMLSVFVLDEVCLRHYLAFDSNLRNLLLAWGIGETGLGQYRLGFCSRQLLSQFAYVWLQMMLVNILYRPAIWLIDTLPAKRALMQWLDSIWGRICAHYGTCRGNSDNVSSGPDDPSDDFTKTHDAAFYVQQQLTKILTTLMAVCVFGSVMPPLLLLMPVGVWLQLRALRWYNVHDNRTFGERLAAHVLLQFPSYMLQASVLLLGLAMSLFFLVDLEFGVGPLALFLCLNAVQIAAIAIGRYVFKPRPRPSRELLYISPAAVAIPAASTTEESFKPRPRPSRELLYISPAAVATPAAGTTEESGLEIELNTLSMRVTAEKPTDTELEPSALTMEQRLAHQKWQKQRFKDF